GLQRVDGDPGMPVVRCSDDHGIDVLACKHFAMVAGGKNVSAPQLSAAFNTALVEVACGDELNTGERGRHACIALAHATGANQRDLDIIVGRHLITPSKSSSQGPIRKSGFRSN